MSYPCPLAKSVVTAVVTFVQRTRRGKRCSLRDNCFHRLLLSDDRDCYFHSSGKVAVDATAVHE